MFVYVKDGNSRDWLIDHGFKMIKNDEANCTWVFVNNRDRVFEDMSAISYVVSDVLTF